MWKKPGSKTSSGVTLQMAQERAVLRGMRKSEDILVSFAATRTVHRVNLNPTQITLICITMKTHCCNSGLCPAFSTLHDFLEKKNNFCSMKFCSVHHFLIRPQLLLHPGLCGLSPTMGHEMPSPRRKKGLQVHGEGKLKRKPLILPTQLGGRAQTSHRGRTCLVHPSWLWNLVIWSLVGMQLLLCPIRMLCP